MARKKWIKIEKLMVYLKPSTQMRMNADAVFMQPVTQPRCLDTSEKSSLGALTTEQQETHRDEAIKHPPFC